MRRSLMTAIPGLLKPRVSGGPSFVGPYDGITTVVAYSVRRLYTAYEGDCLLLRRSSDSEEQAFGFDANGDLDTAAISAWAGEDTLYVKTWYDQSGNGRDVTQADTSKQPVLTLAATNNRAGLVSAGNAALTSSAFTGFPSGRGTAHVVAGWTGTNYIFERSRWSARGASSNRLSQSTNNGTTTSTTNSSLNAFAVDGSFEIVTLMADTGAHRYFNGGVAKGAPASTADMVDESSTLTLLARTGDFVNLEGTICEALFLDGIASDENMNIIGASEADYFDLAWANFT